MNVVIYSKDNCPWCSKIKKEFVDRNIEFVEKVLNKDYTIEEFKTLVNDPSVKTVPQVFIDGTRIGGHDDTVRWLNTLEFVEKM
jgi:glutaredoxin